MKPGTLLHGTMRKALGTYDWSEANDGWANHLYNEWADSTWQDWIWTDDAGDGTEAGTVTSYPTAAVSSVTFTTPLGLETPNASYLMSSASAVSGSRTTMAGLFHGFLLIATFT